MECKKKMSRKNCPSQQRPSRHHSKSRNVVFEARSALSISPAVPVKMPAFGYAGIRQADRYPYEQSMQCPRCHRQNDAMAKRCAACGWAIPPGQHLLEQSGMVEKPNVAGNDDDAAD